VLVLGRGLGVALQVMARLNDGGIEGGVVDVEDLGFVLVDPNGCVESHAATDSTCAP